MPTEQHVYFSADRKVAWFDERLRSTKYGEMRGSGVLIRRGDEWKIAHYNRAFTVPNALANDLVELRKELLEKKQK